MIVFGFIGLQVYGIGNDEEKVGWEICWCNICIKIDNLEVDCWLMVLYVLELNYILNIFIEYEVSKGWCMFWDGKIIEGWCSVCVQEFLEKGWEIEDGVFFVLEFDGGELINGGDIIIRDKFSSFELMLEFKIIEGVNSGIKYFVDLEINKGLGFFIGLEY